MFSGDLDKDGAVLRIIKRMYSAFIVYDPAGIYSCKRSIKKILKKNLLFDRIFFFTTDNEKKHQPKYVYFPYHHKTILQGLYAS